MSDTSYAPQVGDQFRSKPGYAPAGDGGVVATPPRQCQVTAMSHVHVVCLIDGLEYTMTRADFTRLAAKAMAEGATLHRQNAQGEAQPPAKDL